MRSTSQEWWGVRQDLSTLTDPLNKHLSLNKEQEQEYRLVGNQVHHDLEHPFAKYNRAKGNVREQAVFRLVTETLFCTVPRTWQKRDGGEGE